MANKNIGILVIVVAVIFFLIFFSMSRSKQEKYPRFSTGLVTVGTPPPLGDFLPIEGEVATGDGDQVLLSQVYDSPPSGASYLEEELCNECINSCMSYRNREWGEVNPHIMRRRCRKRCGLECSPSSGF